LKLARSNRDFKQNISLGESRQASSEGSKRSNLSHTPNAWYAAPEAHDNVYTSKSDVFSFVLILYDI
jgi:hypothetical protein